MPKLPKRIYKRGERYYLRVVVNGKDIRRSLGTDLREAKRLAGLLMQKIQADATTVVGDAMPTVEEFSERWMDEFVSQGRNAHGVHLARQRLKDHSVPVLGSYPLDRLRISHLRELRASLEAKELSAGSVRHILGDIRTMLRYAMDCGLLAQSPWSKQVMPKMDATIPEPLTADEEKTLLEKTPAEFQLGVRLALLTGIRWSELHRLRWEDYRDLPFPHFVVRKTKAKKDRRVPLLKEAVDLLKPSRKSRGFVLAWRTTYNSTMVNRIRRITKVHFTWHQLRHTFACRWLERGGSAESLQKVLGHSTILLTQRYGRLSDQAVYAEVQRMAHRHGTNHGTHAASDLP